MNQIEKTSITKSALIFLTGALFVMLILQQCNSNASLKREIKQVQIVADRNYNNLIASQDTIKFEKNSKKELVGKIRSYEFDINSLDKNTKQLTSNYVDALNLNKKLKNVNSLLGAQIKIKDSIVNANSNVILNDSTIVVNLSDSKKWDKYNWRTFNGSVSLNRDNFSVNNSVFEFQQGIGIKAAIVVENNISMLKITSSYPGLEFTDIENINLVNDKLNQKQTKKGGWAIGAGVGYGINLNSGQVIGTGPSIGVGLYYSPKWLKF